MLTTDSNKTKLTPPQKMCTNSPSTRANQVASGARANQCTAATDVARCTTGIRTPPRGRLRLECSNSGVHKTLKKSVLTQHYGIREEPGGNQPSPSANVLFLYLNITLKDDLVLVQVFSLNDIPLIER